MRVGRFLISATTPWDRVARDGLSFVVFVPFVVPYPGIWRTGPPLHRAANLPLSVPREGPILHSDTMSFLDALKFNADGLIPAIIQDKANGRVLMMAWMNRTSIERTLETGYTHFWSRSRQKYWKKGESSGHVQRVLDVALDCDGDTLLIQVEQIGAACHEGYRSCFFRSSRESGQAMETTEPRLQNPDEIYGAKGS